jgi:hypothetical protein
LGHPYESKPTAELFSLVLADFDEDDEAYDAETPRAALSVLRGRHTEEVFKFAAEWCTSTIARQRERGLQALAQLGAGKPMEEPPHGRWLIWVNQ